MSDRTPFEKNPRTLQCEEWEALLADALDGALTDEDRASFDLHTAECATCPEMLGEAEKGQQWLQFLHPEPQIPAGLLQKILTQTTGAALPTIAASANVAVMPLPSATGKAEWKHFAVPAGMRRFVEPRMMMTAAMAFFSIALTLNMAGVRFTSLKTQDLRPSALRSNLQRQFYTAKAPVVRYYENLRVVYEVESRMRELRRTSESEETKTPVKTDDTKPAASPENGGSAKSKNGGKSESPHTAGPPIIFVGRPQLAEFETLPECRDRLSNHEMETEVATSLFPQRADQAERSLA
jgi:hypothetical protein